MKYNGKLAVLVVYYKSMTPLVQGKLHRCFRISFFFLSFLKRLTTILQTLKTPLLFQTYNFSIPK